MKHSEFTAALTQAFGEVLGPSYAQDVVLSPWGLTATEALAVGRRPDEVWQALCEAVGQPELRWVHREVRRPK